MYQILVGFASFSKRGQTLSRRNYLILSSLRVIMREYRCWLLSSFWVVNRLSVLGPS